MVIVAIGSALPWATISVYMYSQSKGGLSGDGVITLIVGLLALAFFAVGAIGQARWPFIVAIFMSLIILAVTIIDVADISGKASVGVGLILCIIGGVIGLAAAIGGTVVPRQTA